MARKICLQEIWIQNSPKQINGVQPVMVLWFLSFFLKGYATYKVGP